MWGKVNKNSRNADALSPFLSLASKFYMAIGGIAPRITREIFFLVQNTLDCYGIFFFSCKTPSIVTGIFFSRANDPRLLREIFFLVRTTLDCYEIFFSRVNDPRLHKKGGHFCRRNTPPKTNQKNEVLFHCHAPQQNSTMSCAVKILRNMLSG